ncbi:MAG: cyclic nucleotide-binding domain-containing protein [Acidobacteria bacterium]|nr:cyclic nucleotide-binding domain-containing protein [Acidobacteriota bacterium]
MSIEKLEKHEVFGLLSPDEIKRLSADSGAMVLKQGERIYSEGVPASHIFILIRGRVELKLPTPGGPGLLIDDLLPGNIFGPCCLLGADRYLLNAECVEDSEVLKIEAKALRKILDDNPVVGYAMQRTVSRIYFNRYLKTMETLQREHMHPAGRETRSA